MSQRSLSPTRAFLTAAALGAGLLWLAPQAQADALDDARAAGQVCEQPDGYARAVGGGGDVQALVAEINQKRKAQYESLAAKNGVSVDLVVQEVWEKRLKQFACQ